MNAIYFIWGLIPPKILPEKEEPSTYDHKSSGVGPKNPNLRIPIRAQHHCAVAFEKYVYIHISPTLLRSVCLFAFLVRFGSGLYIYCSRPGAARDDGCVRCTQQAFLLVERHLRFRETHRVTRKHSLLSRMRKFNDTVVHHAASWV